MRYPGLLLSGEESDTMFVTITELQGGGTMKRIIVCALGAFVICALVCNAAWAQATAQISGTVRDQTGAVLPGVEIIATQTETGIARMALTNETGSYVLPNLALGSYRLEASLP